MMNFTEEINHTGPTPVYLDPSVVWKPQPFCNAINDSYDGKMRKQWAGASNDYGLSNQTKLQHQPEFMQPFYGQGQFWNDQTSPFHPSQSIEVHESTIGGPGGKYLGMQGSGSYHPNINNNTFGITNTPPELAHQQWGRSEINQTTPWDVNGMDSGTQQRYRKWEQQESGMMQQNNGFNERVMPNGIPQMRNNAGNGMPMIGHRASGNTQHWMENMGKFDSNNGGRGAVGGSTGSTMVPFMTGPPPPLGMMPGHRQMMGPPPPIPPMHPHPALHHQHQQSFAITNFSMPNNQIQQSTMGMGSLQINDDSMWQDPNGELRKWQRDTGTSIWGDPAKQTGPIQRWQHFTADEVAATSSSKNLSTDPENGWGELPPLNGRATMQGSNNYGATDLLNRQNSTNTNSMGASNWSGDQQGALLNGANGWSDSPHQQSHQIVAQSSQLPVAFSNNSNNYVISNSHYQATSSAVNMNNVTNTTASVMATTTSATPITSMPANATAISVLGMGSALSEEQRQSPSQQQAKVSLAEELSSITALNGIGSIRQNGEVGSLW